MAKHSRVLALPPGLKFSDIEWDVKPASKKPAKKTVAPVKKHRSASKRRRSAKNYVRKAALRWKLRQIARMVAADLLEMRAEANEAAILRWREQQVREAKAFASKLAVEFANAVRKAAANAGN
jgi:hypothetical protein